MFARHLLMLDIDGLRPDVLSEALAQNRVPHLAHLLGGHKLTRGVQIPAVSTGNSTTFCAQASLFTGAHPKDHGIQGNQFLNRFGTFENDRPRRLGLDSGDILAFDDAFRVFASGFAAEQLRTATVYERYRSLGMRSVVAGNMYATGADHWIRPSFWRTGMMIKGKGPLKVQPQDCDRYVVKQLIKHIEQHGLPQIVTSYFMGIDKVSHDGGPAAQMAYLVNYIDPLVGELWRCIEAHLPADGELFVSIFSDHGQSEVTNDSDHALRIAPPFKDDLVYLLQAWKRNLYRGPWQRLETTDVFMGINGGCATVYLRNLHGSWADVPDFGRDILPVAYAFWEGHRWGTYGPKLQHALAAVFVRNVQKFGWDAPYQALTPDGSIISLEEWFAEHAEGTFVDPVNRLQNLASPLASDVLLLPNTDGGYYFGEPHAGNHGGLHPDESYATLFYGWPGAAEADWHEVKHHISAAIEARCQEENGRQPSVADMLTGVDVFVKREEYRQLLASSQFVLK